ncbi:MAG: WecB/TagA/CpsF family glycosyltransferase [Rhodopseudomonas palustris]|uniref:WecB/TagA/CpsF family glycosyltransferase n=1 Tax=Rhodopseudomonas pseudopalustris TaxID=1513892 RepID=UPI003DBBA5E2|nr:WecB/TagA/CpsF family glycosyltransferase [Rhodopseudomonas palustris]
MANVPDTIDPIDVEAEADNRRSGDRRKAPYQPGDTSFGPERRNQGDRRRSPFQQWPRVVLGGLPIAVVDREQSAKAMVDEALRRRGLWRYPAYLTSANGEVTYRCATNDAERELFMQADAIHADGMPHVFASRVRCDEALPERVATTDLFYDVAAEAEARGATMYMLGATEQANAAAAAKVMERFPKLKLVGRRHGFFDSTDDEIAACNEIAALSPDILWVSMGVPYEQQFVIRNRQRLTSVGVIKTSGGLFDWLTETKPRAPQWMQNLGLEWLWRIWLEPRRLGWRYLKTNPYALFLLLTRSR